MTMSTRSRQHFRKFIASMRTEWDEPGIDTALMQLGLRISDPFEVAALMVAWARRGDARTPAGVLQPALRTATDPAPTARQSPGWTDTVWCDEHGAKSKLRPDGTAACCWSGDAAPEPFRRTGTSGPSDEVRARIAAAVGPGRTADRANETPGDATTSTEGAGCG